jgi:hypothetical protein
MDWKKGNSIGEASQILIDGLFLNEKERTRIEIKHPLHYCVRYTREKVKQSPLQKEQLPFERHRGFV